jgi:hypothetical protein
MDPSTVRLVSKESVAGRQVIGTTLVLVGALLLLAEFTDLDMGRWGWPFFVIVPGAVLLGTGLTRSSRAGLGLTVAGSIVGAVGLLLLYQSVTGHWESWAYAWALVAPGAVGAGIWLWGVRANEAGRSQQGARVATIGLIIFLVGFAFFEGLLEISQRDLGVVGDVLLPVLVIAAGAWVAFRPRRRPKDSVVEAPSDD